ncbi:hypothetical protein QFZ62_001315 [Clavibacter sp. B3I6]|nr:hypothetical protein [Clavibacter sp. B3I6]
MRRRMVQTRMTPDPRAAGTAARPAPSPAPSTARATGSAA